MPTEPDSRILNAVRTPLVLIALFALIIGGVSEGLILSGIPWQARMVIYGVDILYFLGVLIWMARIIERNPRSLSYGPHEYLEESRLAHKLNLKLPG